MILVGVICFIVGAVSGIFITALTCSIHNYNVKVEGKEFNNAPRD